jgi:DNA-binding transcriptional ArsR family regulator
MEDKVILDKKSFKALSANSRVSILKKLTERRMTLTELSKRLNLKGSTIKEHCTILLNAELIKKIDEGRKWKYYELTGKGKQIVAPSFMNEARVLVTLCLSVIMFTSLLFIAFQATMSMGSLSYTTQNNDFYLGGVQSSIAQDAPLASSENVFESGVDSTAKTTISEPDTNEIDSNRRLENNSPIPIFPVTLIGMLVIGILIGWYARKRI